MISPIMPFYNRAPTKFIYGGGVYLYDADNKQYLDMAAGYAANSFGHCHPRLVKALQRQSEKFWHLSNRFEIPGMYQYSKKLVDNTFADTVYIANTGAEAVESAIKVARKYFKTKGLKNKYRVITIDGAFHGRTLACASAGSKEKIVGFEPPVDGFDRVAFNDIAALQAAVTEDTMAVMIEPIQGEGGIRPHSREYMQQLRELCTAHNLLLILDEVQCGAGRTGYFCAYDMYGIKPDLVALAKGIGGGFPVSACLATEEIGQAMEIGIHGSTFGGNPLAIAVASEVLDMLLAPGFLEGVQGMGEFLKRELQNLLSLHSDKVLEVRGTGLMLGIQLVNDISARKFIDHLLSHQLISIAAAENVVRFTPPLIIERSHCAEAISKLDKALRDY